MKYGTESLVMAEKNIFASKLFLLLNISDFNFFFYVKICIHLPPLKKVTPSFSATPYQSGGPVKPPFLKILFQVQPPTPPSRKGGVHTLGDPQFLARENRLTFFIYFKPLRDFF